MSEFERKSWMKSRKYESEISDAVECEGCGQKIEILLGIGFEPSEKCPKCGFVGEERKESGQSSSVEV